jgi:hypothetical protein
LFPLPLWSATALTVTTDVYVSALGVWAYVPVGNVAVIPVPGRTTVAAAVNGDCETPLSVQLNVAVVFLPAPVHVSTIEFVELDGVPANVTAGGDVPVAITGPCTTVTPIRASSQSASPDIWVGMKAPPVAARACGDMFHAPEPGRIRPPFAARACGDMFHAPEDDTAP